MQDRSLLKSPQLRTDDSEYHYSKLLFGAVEFAHIHVCYNDPKDIKAMQDKSLLQT